MLKNRDVLTEIEAALTALVDNGTLPSCKIAPYAGQIDPIRLVVEAGTFPTIFFNWREDQADDSINEDRSDVVVVSLLVCTDSAVGQDQALQIVDIIKEHFFGVWTGEDGLRIFDVFRGPARSLLNGKRKQIISLEVRVEE